MLNKLNKIVNVAVDVATPMVVAVWLFRLMNVYDSWKEK